jgi:hypothetical protein
VKASASRWEGRVLATSNGTLVVELSRLDSDSPTLLADLPTSLLGTDLSSAAVGDILDLSVGTVRDENGHLARAFSLKLRQLVRLGEDEFRLIGDIAEAHAMFFKE